MRKYGVKIKDRFLAGLLALIMIIGMLPLTVTAAPEDDVQQSEQDLFVVTVTEVGGDGLEKAVGGRHGGTGRNAAKGYYGGNGRKRAGQD